MTARMRPDLRTTPALVPVPGALRRREPIFRRPEFGHSRADFERTVAADFREIGASGNRYSRTHRLNVQALRKADPAEQGLA